METAAGLAPRGCPCGREKYRLLQVDERLGGIAPGTRAHAELVMGKLPSRRQRCRAFEPVDTDGRADPAVRDQPHDVTRLGGTRVELQHTSQMRARRRIIALVK